MKILCIGHSAYDISFEVENLPMENTKNFYRDLLFNSGGAASNMAYLLGKYGIDTYLASSVGDDTYGTLIKKELETVNVHTEYMETAYDKKTDIEIIMINKNNHAKTILQLSKESLFLKKSDFLMNPDLILIDGYDYGASLAALNKFPNKTSIITANTCTTETIELSKYCTYIIMSREFAEWMTKITINYDNPQSLVTLYSALLNKFPRKQIIVTLEEKGAMFMTDNQIKVMPGLVVNAVDTTGAGNVFQAAFAYALMQQYDLEKAVTFANIAAGLSVTKRGTKESIPELSDIMTYFNQKFGIQNANN